MCRAMIRKTNPDFSRLLTYYRQEMAYLLSSGQLFAKAYPRIAQGLDFSHKGSSDPHVERLLESFAFLTAKLQLNLEDEHTFFSSALLQALYPQLVSPIPSCVMVKTAAIPQMAQKLAGTIIPARTQLTATSNSGESCVFQTTMATQIWPLEVVEVGYDRVHNHQITPNHLIKSPWLFKVRIRSTVGSFKGLDINTLQLHLGGDILTALTLFRWLNTYDPYAPTPVFVQKESDGPLTLLGEKPFKPVGFDESEALVPSPMQLTSGHRLLLEYFMFPSKFLFIEIEEFSKAFSGVQGDEITLFFALGPQAYPEKWPMVKQNVQIGCVPAVNLFFKTADPIRVDHQKMEYRLFPDRRRESALEIHSILKISSATDMRTPAQIYEPYFSYTNQTPRKGGCFWVQKRVRCRSKEIPGTDLMLSFVDENFHTKTPSDMTIYAHTLCTNRRFAEKLPVGATLDLMGDFAGIKAVTMDRPTPSVMPAMDGETQWRLISHLSLDHLGVCTQTGSIEPLRELLRLYNVGQSSMVGVIESIQSLTVKTSMGRIGVDAWRGFVPLLSLSLTIDDVRANTQGYFLLNMILHEFFRSTAGFNTLVETQMISQSTGRLFKKWLAKPCTNRLI
jgi:type VI secretion system protein ImpG